jgi:NRPS condensation-like uncharacterized protein
LDTPLSTKEGNRIFWLPLDNAAKIYPAVQSREHTTVFRISVILKERVKIQAFLAAVQKTEQRFFYFKVCLKKGLFWYYLEYIDRPLVPVADKNGLCRAFRDSSLQKNFLFRILVFNNRISVEFSHILTDGTGARMFLITLLKAYFNELNYSGINPGIPDYDRIPKEEYEDAYNHYFNADIPSVISYSKAFHVPYKPSDPFHFEITVARLSLNDVKSKAHEKNVSLSDYLIAAYLLVLQEIHSDLRKFSRAAKRKILRVQVPVNLRNIYPTVSMRNFSLFVLPEIDLRLGHYTFDEILKIAHHKMQLETDEKLINKIISRNVGSERNLLVRGIPLFLKNKILRYKFYSQGANQYSGVMTNLGRIDLPVELSEKVDHFVFIPPPPNKKLKINCGVVGFKDELVITFGNITGSNELQKKFFRFLASQGIHVKLITYL